MKRFGLFLTAVLPFFAAELIQYIASNSMYLIYTFFAGLQSGQREIPGSSTIYANGGVAVSQELLYLFSVFGIVVCGIIFYFWYRYESCGELCGSLGDVLTMKNIGLFIVLGTGCQLFFTGMMSLLTPVLVNAFSDYAEVLISLTSGNDIMVILLMLVIAPVTEEFIFRGVILHMAGRYVSFLGANLLQALLFGIYHQNIVQGIYAALLGFLLGLMYYKFKSIIAPIILHIIINASSFLTYLFPDTQVSYIAIMIAGGSFAIIALVVLRPDQKVPLSFPGEPTE